MMMRAFFHSLTAFLTVTTIVYLALVIGVLTYWEITGYQDREGAGSMGLIFILGPGLALPSGILAAIVTFVKARKRSAGAT